MDPQIITKATIVDKPILAPAGTAIPQKGHIVNLKIWSDGQPEDKAFSANYLLGNRELDENIQQIVYQMKVGDAWRVRFVNKITQKQQIIHIGVISTEKSEIQLSNSVTPVNSRSQTLKKQGNQYIKEKKYEQAIESYKRSYALIEYSCDQEALDIRLSLMSNLALATLNCNRFRECLDWCEKWNWESVQQNKKIAYREVNAYKGLREWKKAREKIQQALQIFKSDADAVQDFTNLKDQIDKQQKIEGAKQKKMYANMLG